MTRAMSLSTKLRWGALALVVAVVGAALIWVPFPTELASTCCLVAVPVSLSVFLYLALNRFGRSKRYRYLGFFLPVLCVLIYAVVVDVLARVEVGTGNSEAGEAAEILEFLSEIWSHFEAPRVALPIPTTLINLAKGSGTVVKPSASSNLTNSLSRNKTGNASERKSNASRMHSASLTMSRLAGLSFR